MKNIVIVYHAYLYGEHYMDMLTDQFRKIINAKALEDGTMEPNLFHYCKKMYVGIIDSSHKKPQGGVEWIARFLNFTSSKENDGTTRSKVEIKVHPDNNTEEGLTLKWISDYSRENPGDYILYFHSKGISKYSKYTEDWRNYMEYFLIENWKDCIARLDEGYDCCGVMWNQDTPFGHHPHFSGNFWWANTSYINTLDHKMLDTKLRFDREFWIGSNPNVKAFEFHNSRLNDKVRLMSSKSHYDLEYPRSKYVKGKKVTLHIVVTVFNRLLTLKRLIYDLFLQTNKNFIIHVVQDGPDKSGIGKYISSLEEPHPPVTFTATSKVHGHFGFANRNFMLSKIEGDPDDYILFTNDDNQYLQTFVDAFLNNAKGSTGFIFCNTIHSYLNYDVLRTSIRVGYIDMGSFIVKLDVAKAVGFSRLGETADGTYAEECAAECRKRGLDIVMIDKALFIHN